LIYGVTIWGFAMAWLTIAVAITTKTAREHLPFAPTWWSFVFPIGTLVTGTSELALISGSDVLKYIAAALYLVLLCVWLTVATGSLTASLRGQVSAAGATRAEEAFS
jgi:tellurite resistance protein TehA-like permease